MKISAEYVDHKYRVLNHGRMIGEYPTWADFNQAMNNLDRVRLQLDGPEAFCDCKPTEETR